MKKVLALVLAVVLAFGMTTVAFAATKAGEVKFDSGAALYTFNDDDQMIAVGGTIANASLFGNKEYFIKVVDADASPITLDKLSTLGDVKVRTSIDTGASYIASKPAFVIKNVKAGGDLAAGKQAFVAFKTADKFNMDEVDLEMTITLYDKNGDDNNSAETIAGNVSYASSKVASFYRVTGAINNFDDIDGEVEMEFGDEVATFVVNADGQKELFLRLDDSDDALEDKYPEADLSIVYFAGNNKTFRRNGTLTIPAKMVEGKDGKLVAPFIYNNENGKLVINKDAKYDEDAEAFVIKTNKLGKYVISDKELKADAATDKEDGAETNPDTGANDFVGLAVALAVVSVAGIAVAKRK